MCSGFLLTTNFENIWHSLHFNRKILQFFPMKSLLMTFFFPLLMIWCLFYIHWWWSCRSFDFAIFSLLKFIILMCLLLGRILYNMKYSLNKYSNQNDRICYKFDTVYIKNINVTIILLITDWHRRSLGWRTKRLNKRHVEKLFYY